jgi:hypothetical protein
MKRKHKSKIITSQATKKMSEILLDFAWNYAIQDQTDPMQRQHFMNVACSAWNFSLLSEDDCQRAIASFIDNMRDCRDQNDEANMKALENDLHALIAWKKEHYPTIRKMVVSAELYDDGDKVGCRTASADYDAMVTAKLAK